MRTLSIGETWRGPRLTRTVSTGAAVESIFIPVMLEESFIPDMLAESVVVEVVVFMALSPC